MYMICENVDQMIEELERQINLAQERSEDLGRLQKDRTFSKGEVYALSFALDIAQSLKHETERAARKAAQE